MIKLDYESRGLDICQFCALKYNVGERIPRILVHCGHTLCTTCIQSLHHKDRVRCPVCRKLVKNLETVERLPLNIDILYEVVERDQILSKITFDFDEEAELSILLCNDPYIQELNGQWRNKSAPTDVLSFPQA